MASVTGLTIAGKMTAAETRKNGTDPFWPKSILGWSIAAAAAAPIATTTYSIRKEKRTEQ